MFEPSGSSCSTNPQRGLLLLHDPPPFHPSLLPPFPSFLQTKQHFCVLFVPSGSPSPPPQPIFLLCSRSREIVNSRFLGAWGPKQRVQQSTEVGLCYWGIRGVKVRLPPPASPPPPPPTSSASTSCFLPSLCPCIADKEEDAEGTWESRPPVFLTPLCQ